MGDSAQDCEEENEGCYDSVFMRFMGEILMIKQDLNKINEEIEIIKTKQEIKEVKLERVGMIAKIHDAKLVKLEEKVFENDKKVKGVGRKLEKFEQVFEGARDYHEKNCLLVRKEERIEKVVKMLSRKQSSQ